MMSDFALKTSSPSRIQRAGKLRGTLALAGALFLGSAVTLPAHAQGTKIGFVNTERILRESGPAKTAQSKIESEFKRRDDELQRLSSSLRSQAEKFDKDSPVLSETDRVNRQRDLSRLDTDLQRKRREFQEDFNRRRNEEFSSIVTKANQAIKKIAEQENYDLIVQDAVTVNPRIDITDKVIQALGK
ncbi:OmpH family outer membrane protein [Bordetella genomosp. 4]|uniref:Outer membrane protein chaperone n=1 Tax=Bordetella genomosp. 4 TaxID=463044 RepID=A0A261U2S3_9BORD|nr:OmpH family outer membrane protein [Bordetella genomosp. 4]OZI49727.1 outer membrane protein chaperone [Bordetella genomosp. 4]OZI56169.1 outer membrane protein chaperone [Bordetella genomosp. 4]